LSCAYTITSGLTLFAREWTPATGREELPSPSANRRHPDENLTRVY